MSTLSWGSRCGSPLVTCPASGTPADVSPAAKTSLPYQAAVLGGTLSDAFGQLPSLAFSCSQGHSHILALPNHAPAGCSLPLSLLFSQSLPFKAAPSILPKPPEPLNSGDTSWVLLRALSPQASPRSEVPPHVLCYVLSPSKLCYWGPFLYGSKAGLPCSYRFPLSEAYSFLLHSIGVGDRSGVQMSA